MATQFGTNGVFGIAANETGVLQQSFTWDFTQQEKLLPGTSGDPIGEANYAEVLNLSYEGYLPASSAFATTLASAITLVTTPTDYFKGSIGSTTICKQVTVTGNVEDYQRVTVNATNRPGY